MVTKRLLSSSKRWVAAAMLLVALAIAFLYVSFEGAENKRVADVAFSNGFEVKFSRDDSFWMDGSRRDFINRSHFYWWIRGHLQSVRVPCSTTSSRTVQEGIQHLKDGGVEIETLTLPDGLDFPDGYLDEIEESTRVERYTCYSAQ